VSFESPAEGGYWITTQQTLRRLAGRS